MKCHPIIPLIVAGVLLGASPVLARDHGPAITITARLGDLVPRPPAVVVVREPAWREQVVVVERGGPERRRGHRDYDRRAESCGERDRRSERVYERVYYGDKHRHGWREPRRDERVVIVKRGWSRWDD